MKKIVSVVALMVVGIVSAQSEYLHSSIDFEVGAVKVRDYTPVRPFNVDLGYRYMATPIIGAKLSLNYTRIYEQWEFKGPEEPAQYISGTLMGVLNVGRLAQMEDVFNNKVTILSGIGGNLSRSNGSTNSTYFFRDTNFHLAAFTDLEFKVSKRVFLRTGLDVVTGVNVERNDFKSETTTILNFNAGVTIALGNGKKEHADWYIAPQKVDTVLLQPTIIDNTITKREIYNVEAKCNCDITESVYFDHDDDYIDIQGLNAIEKTTDRLKVNGKVILRAYCSNVGNVEYNKDLARRRAESVKEKMVETGIDKDSITIEAIGIDTSRNKEVFDMARRVQIIIRN